MARIAVIADIHGNVVALRAALDDIGRQAVDRIICLGDIAATGPQPLETIEMIRSGGIATIRGNADIELLDPPDPELAEDDMRKFFEMSVWAAELLSNEDRQFLMTLPFSHQLDLDGAGMLLGVHGSPRSVDEGVYADTADEVLDEMLDEGGPAAMVCGHTHLQLLRRHRHTLIVNPGAVGLAYAPAPPADPLGVAWAEYAIIDSSDGALGVEFRRVYYAVEELHAAITESGMPHADWWRNLWRSAPS